MTLVNLTCINKKSFRAELQFKKKKKKVGRELYIAFDFSALLEIKPGNVF